MPPFFRWWMLQTFLDQKGWNNKAVKPNYIPQRIFYRFIIHVFSLTSCYQHHPSLHSRPVANQQCSTFSYEKKKSGCIINVFACTMQSFCVNKRIMCTVLQLGVKQCYLHKPCNTPLDTQNHKPCLLNNNLSAWMCFRSVTDQLRSVAISACIQRDCVTWALVLSCMCNENIEYNIKVPRILK